METIYNILHSEYFLVAIAILNIILILLYVMNTRRLSKINKNYKTFIRKLGNGNNIEDVIRTYINQVEEVKEKSEELTKLCYRLDKDLELCIRKVGIVRYNAYGDAGNNLSFALALLNDKNDGVVLNGIYSREMSNIYAKSIKNGEANNTLSKEEMQAINIACNQVKQKKNLDN